MAAETGFTIADVIHEIPSLDTFTMDEAQVLYDYSGLTIEDFALDEEDPASEEKQLEKWKNPGFLRAMMHIAYQRANPRANRAKVQAVIGATNMIAAISTLAEAEDDAVPPASTTEPSGSSPSDSVEWSEPSGNGSTNDSDAPVVPLTPTGTSRSDTSSISPPESLVS